jgi:hypothetical protein
VVEKKGVSLHLRRKQKKSRTNLQLSHVREDLVAVLRDHTDIPPIDLLLELLLHLLQQPLTLLRLVFLAQLRDPVLRVDDFLTRIKDTDFVVVVRRTTTVERRLSFVFVASLLVVRELDVVGPLVARRLSVSVLVDRHLVDDPVVRAGVGVGDAEADGRSDAVVPKGLDITSLTAGVTTVRAGPLALLHSGSCWRRSGGDGRLARLGAEGSASRTGGFGLKSVAVGRGGGGGGTNLETGETGAGGGGRLGSDGRNGLVGGCGAGTSDGFGDDETLFRVTVDVGLLRPSRESVSDEFETKNAVVEITEHSHIEGERNAPSLLLLRS